MNQHLIKTYFHQAYISFLCMLHTELNQNGWPIVTEPPCMALMCHAMYYSLNIQKHPRGFSGVLGAGSC